MKLIKLSIITLILGLITLSPLAFTAETKDLDSCPPDQSFEECQKIILDQIGVTSQYGQTTDAVTAGNNLATKVGNVLTIILGFLGVIFLFYVTYSGIQWMTAGGNEEKISTARSRIIRASVGLIIIASAYAISSFIITKIQPEKTARNLIQK